MRQLLLLALLLSLAANAQIRYHFGDDSRWADPQFDDFAWPVVEKDAFPAPPQHGDGFVWVRQRVTGPAGDAALWLRLTHEHWIPTSTARFMQRSLICPLAWELGRSWPPAGSGCRPASAELQSHCPLSRSVPVMRFGWLRFARARSTATSRRTTSSRWSLRRSGRRLMAWPARCCCRPPACLATRRRRARFRVSMPIPVS